MLWLARTALSSPLHAISLAVGFTILPLLTWLGAAIAALIMLAKGPKDGVSCFVAALIPSIYFAVEGEGQRADFIYLSLTWLIAVVLWWSRSWIWVLGALVVAGAAQHLLFPVVTDQQLTLLVNEVGKLLEELAKQNPEAGVFQAPDPVMYSGMIQFAVMFGALISLMFARMLQAAIYNPGGFQKEFHSIRLPSSFVSLLILVTLLVGLTDGSLNGLIPMMMLPLAIAGISLVHGSIGIKKLGGNWLVLFYISLVLVGSLTLLLLVVFAVLDSAFDFRKRLANKINSDSQ
ncbi:hypothetical protein [Litoribacillus peritrichatus]|uniref:DUF2232 domain-containing protein n=1 Tax=Litoribacillus peritrichatus TaxID=718191 RepID=A0ABP7MPC4_9GAMM